MATITQRITEAKNIYKIYWDSFTKGDLETFASTWLKETGEGKGREFIFQIPINTDNR
jgi:hypothetical protein